MNYSTKRHKGVLRIICVVVILSFLYTDIIWAMPSGGIRTSADLGLDSHYLDLMDFPHFELSNLYLPEHIGDVKEIWTPKEDLQDKGRTPLIIHLQDSHANYQAQNNIAKILEFLNKEVNPGQLFLVALEGADSPLDTVPLRAISNKKIRQDIATSHIKRGFLTGAEYYSSFCEAPILFQGVDDRELYLEDLSSFQELHRFKGSVAEIWSSIEDVNKRINKIKNKMYSPELLDFSNKAIQYKRDQMPLVEYTKFLQKKIQTLGLGTKDFPNFNLVIRAVDLEKQIDLGLVSEERRDLIDYLGKSLVKEELKEMVRKSLEFRLGRISSLTYYIYIYIYRRILEEFGHRLSQSIQIY